MEGKVATELAAGLLADVRSLTFQSLLLFLYLLEKTEMKLCFLCRSTDWCQISSLPREIYGHLLTRLVKMMKKKYPHEGALFMFLPRLLATVNETDEIFLGSTQPPPLRLLAFPPSRRKESRRQNWPRFQRANAGEDLRG